MLYYPSMKNIKNNKIVSGSSILLLLLAILAVGFMALPNQASAQANLEDIKPGVNLIEPNSGSRTNKDTVVAIVGYNYTPNSVARWNGSPRPTIFIDSSHLLIRLSPSDLEDSNGKYINVYVPGVGYSNARFFEINGYAAPAPSEEAVDPNSHLYTDNPEATQNAQTENGSTVGENASALASTAILGSNSFLPSGLMQWILFAIIILLIIIIVRKVLGLGDKYHNTPLKHA
jgi:hypothetical protein